MSFPDDPGLTMTIHATSPGDHYRIAQALHSLAVQIIHGELVWHSGGLTITNSEDLLTISSDLTLRPGNTPLN